MEHYPNSVSPKDVHPKDRAIIESITETLDEYDQYVHRFQTPIVTEIVRRTVEVDEV